MKPILRFASTGLALFILGLTNTTALAADDADDAQQQRLRMQFYFQGRHLFESQCAPCHGERGRGDGPWAEYMTTKPRNFRSGIFKFRTTPLGKLPTADDLRRTIRSGISGTAMPTFQKLSDRDITSLIVYLQGFSKNWKDAELQAEALQLPELPAWFRDTDQLAKNADAGATKFAQLCSTCHGPKGKGDGIAAKGLIDFWENPIVPADLTNEHHKSGDAPTDLYRTIATGLNGTPMIGFADTLSEEVIWNLVAFIKHNEVKGQRVEEAVDRAEK